MYKEIDGDLIQLAKQGYIEVVAHGCNCFCTMGAGIAPQMAEAFMCDAFPLEQTIHRGDITKLGQIDWVTDDEKDLTVINCYTQYGFGSNHPNGTDKPLDYEALTLCMRKINHEFRGKKIGLPRIGCGLAGGDWNRVKQIIQTELRDCDVTVVNYKSGE